MGECRAEALSRYTVLYAPKSAAGSSEVKRGEEVDLEARLFAVFINKKTQRGT